MLFSWSGEAPTLPAGLSLTNCTYYPKPRFIFRLIAVAFCLQAFLAYGKSPERHEGEPHLDLAPPQFEQHLSHVFSLLDSKKFEEAISYSNSVENLPEEWKEYLVANTHYEIIIPEEKCFEHSKKNSKKQKTPESNTLKALRNGIKLSLSLLQR